MQGSVGAYNTIRNLNLCQELPVNNGSSFEFYHTCATAFMRHIDLAMYEYLGKDI
jgi:hypothetical protein